MRDEYPGGGTIFRFNPRGSAQWPLKESSTPVDSCIGSLAARAPTQVSIGSIPGAACDVVGIWGGAFSGHMKVSFQAARSIG